MALISNATPITILANRKASYAPILSQDGIQLLPVNTTVAFFPDDVDQTVAANAIAVGTVNAAGICSNVELLPGCVYRVTTSAGVFATARFCAPPIVGPVIKPGDNVSGA